MISSLLHLVGLRPRVYYTLTNFRGGQGHPDPPPQYANVLCIAHIAHTSVTELMWGLHWLPIRARIQYKILLLVYKAFTNGSPTYLADMMTSCNPVRSTRSSHKVNLLVVPHQKSNKYSEKAFAVVGPRLWNELLTDELRGCNSVDTFKKKVKTMLFKKHY